MEALAPVSSRNLSRDICVPRVADGILYYTLLEMVNMDEAGSDWTSRYKAAQRPVGTAVTTSATPRALTLSTSV